MTSNSKTVMFVSGAFVSHHCWDRWIEYFGQHGYEAFAPPWPFKDAPARVLREKQPYDSALAALTLDEVIESYANTAIRLREKPIIIGHSLGGLITQVLVNRNLARAGVAIHSVPPQGVFPYEFTFLRSTWKVLGLFSSMKKTYLMSFSDFQYAFVNGMPLGLQMEAYEKYAIPESKTVARGGLTAAASVDFEKEHRPLLLTTGEFDHIIPPHLSKRIYKRYKKNNGSVLDFKEFEGINHSVLTGPQWKEEADYILNWLKNHVV